MCPAGSVVEFHGNRFAPWLAFRPHLDVAIKAKASIHIAMEPLDPALGIDTTFHLPIATPEESPVRVTLRREAEGLRAEPADISGRPVAVAIPMDAELEETVHALIRLRLAGAAAFSFE